MTAIGSTSLYDAIGDTAKKLGDRPSPRRAVVVITDGVDTSSSMKPSDVSGIASAIDVPVYVVAVVSPLDHPGEELGGAGDQVSGQLENLAYWTGGNLTLVSTPAHASLAARELITELRHQYLLAFEASKETGLVLARCQNPAPRADRARTQRVLRQSVATVQLKPER